MLVVKQVEAEAEQELAYECYDNEQIVGRLTAQFRADGSLETRLFDITRREARRTLLAKLERDATAHGVAGLYLHVHDHKEGEDFLPAGYAPIQGEDLVLYKRLEAGI